MILVWYNQKVQKVYLHFVKYCDYEINHLNKRGHVLIQIFILENEKLVSIKSYSNHYFERYRKTIKQPLKEKLIKRLIRFLEKQVR
jgi:hypothetical protein